MKIKEKLTPTKPMRVFWIFVVVLLSIIIALGVLRKEQPESEGTEYNATYADVSGFEISIKALGEVNDSSVVTIYAQTAGIVTSVLKPSGSYVTSGQTIVTLDNTYSGANASAIQSAIATAQLGNYEKTYEKQLDLLNTQRELADKQVQNQEELRKLGRAGSDRTESIIETNQTAITSIKSSIAELSSQSGTEDQVQSLTSTLNQLEATNAQLITANDAAKYQSSDDNPPAGLSNVQRDLTKKQLDIQETALNLNGEILRLQSKAAQIAVSLTRPSSPLGGEVVEIYVSQYDVVSPGMPLATVRSNQGSISLTSYVPFGASELIDSNTKVIASYKGELYEGSVTYVATYPTKGDMYAVTVTLDSGSKPLPNNSYIELEFTLPAPCNYLTGICYLPLDSITITDEHTYAYYVKDNNLQSIEVDLVDVIGNAAQVTGVIETNQFVYPNER